MAPAPEFAPEHRLQLALGNERRHRRGVTGKLGDAEIGRPENAAGLKVMRGDEHRRPVRRRAVDRPIADKRQHNEQDADQRQWPHEPAPDGRTACLASSGLRRRTLTWPFSLGWRSTSLGRCERI